MMIKCIVPNKVLRGKTKKTTLDFDEELRIDEKNVCLRFVNRSDLSWRCLIFMVFYSSGSER